MSRTRSATPDGHRKDFELAALNREIRDALRKHRLGHRSRFSFDPGFTVPVMRVDENVAEKLGRWQERALVRDLYDLAALSTSIDDPQLVTRMWVPKSHTGMTSGSRRGRGGPVASIDELTADKPSTPFVLGDLVLPAGPPDTAKRRLIEANLATSLLLIRWSSSTRPAGAVGSVAEMAVPLYGCLLVGAAGQRVPVGVVNPSTSRLAGDLAGSRGDGVGGHWWYRLEANDFRSCQLAGTVGNYRRPPGW